MSDKSSSDNNYAAHEEKNEKQAGWDMGNEAVDETGGRRRSSVALNVIENPLKVRLSIALSAAR